MGGGGGGGGGREIHEKEVKIPKQQIEVFFGLKMLFRWI